MGNSVLKKCSAEVVAKLFKDWVRERRWLWFRAERLVLPVLGKLRLLGRELIPDLTVRPNELVWCSTSQFREEGAARIRPPSLTGTSPAR